jgi:hypothetical protein
MENTPIPIPHFEPWKKYPSLAPERLTIVANLISDVRHQAVLAHEPGVGDTNWGLGTRVYERTCFGLETAAPEYPDWLHILPETKGLQFSFAIGSVPFRFYRGKPDEPPDRYNIRTFGELHHLQTCLQLEGLRPLDTILRLAIETSPATLELSTISVVEVDDIGNPLAVYAIPLEKPQVRTAITVMQAKPVELAPPQIEPLEKIEEIADSEKRANESLTKTDTGSE